MKIGIMTFHWATNHGAILQTYATQNYLQKQYPHHEVEVIHYAPSHHKITFIGSVKRSVKEWSLQGIREYRKEQKLEYFRQTHLVLSPRYDSYEWLMRNHNQYDVVFFGSDQIWNPYFLQHGEGHVNDAYFGQFCSNNTIKSALCVSFGCKEYPDTAKVLAQPLIESFRGISVREKSALSILESMGIPNAVQLPDPTVLLKAEEILAFCNDIPKSAGPIIAVNCIRETGKRKKQLIDVYKEHISNSKVQDIQMLSIEQWLAGIRDSSIVITDSFHCVMMCLRLHKDFVIIPAEGTLSGMNDRFVTVLEPLGLLDRVQGKNPRMSGTVEHIEDWEAVDQYLQKESERLKAFIGAQLHERNDG